MSTCRQVFFFNRKYHNTTQSVVGWIWGFTDCKVVCELSMTLRVSTANSIVYVSDKRNCSCFYWYRIRISILNLMAQRNDSHLFYKQICNLDSICLGMLFVWASLVAQLVKNPLAMQETWVQSLGWEDSPGEGKGYSLQYSGLENSMNCIVHVIQRVGHNWVTFTFHFILLKKDMYLFIAVGT